MPSSPATGAIPVLTGSYTTDSGGDGPGIAALLLDPATGRMAYDDEVKPLPVSGASFLAAHPSLDVVYSTNETETGTVSAVARAADGTLSPLGDPASSGGANPCHLTVHPSGEWLLTANYGSDIAPGTVAVHRLGADGRLREPTDLVVHQGSGPVTGRQEGSHAHQVLVDPAGRFVLATDLGADAVLTYRLDTLTGTLERAAVNPMPSGSGPRHLAFAPGGDLVFSADELSSTVTCHGYDATDGTLTALSSAPATTVKDVVNQPGGIVASPCGRFVWVTNRGADTIAAFRLAGTVLEPLGEVLAGGTWPRGLALVGGHLLVANQHSGTLAALRVQQDGTLAQPHPPISAPSVVCALAL
ncbi:lactonase family protein [Streptomyces canus]|uniref:6-phosphogluconolactonase n=1 Tax=Streptomyces canus TaxID=58343 RepID=A0AAW8F714_9ACTN|nr:lactonase family protein [Streptomyces canus]MDQ0766923.1 6-phosphogluconolactonase [Streptomyces canus]MDQ0905050.1 6-phosphogluconolactonase [Streptomyces canus]MDQ1064948.1 6-phosphogluconolactonase [Streptomyces canus]